MLKHPPVPLGRRPSALDTVAPPLQARRPYPITREPETGPYLIRRGPSHLHPPLTGPLASFQPPRRLPPARRYAQLSNFRHSVASDGLRTSHFASQSAFRLLRCMRPQGLLEHRFTGLGASTPISVPTPHMEDALNFYPRDKKVIDDNPHVTIL